MLVEIYSPVFEGKLIENNTIRFKKGLNVVLGMDDATNSIGKSSALLAIDFVFGGKSYLKSDGVEHLPGHSIFFTFCFNGKNFYFGRNTLTPDVVICYQDGYEEQMGQMNISEFVDWLKVQYCFDYPGLSFREATSSFFRIYGKENSNEILPLQGIKGKGQEASIEIFIKVFNKFSSVEDLKAEKDELKRQFKVFEDAREYSFVPNKINSNADYEANQKKIYELTLKLNDFDFTRTSKPSDEDIERLNQSKKLKSQVLKLEREEQRLNSKLQLLDFSLKRGLKPTEADLEGLSEFFPGVSLKKLYEVEAFHEKLSTILEDEFQSESNIVQNELGGCSQEIKKLNKEIDDLNVKDDSMSEAFESYSELKDEIKELKAQNNAYIEDKELNQHKQEALDKYKEKCMALLPTLEEPVNAKMSQYNRSLYEEPHKPPYLHFNSFRSYTFETPDDKGAGTNYKGMILYDLAVFSLTNLPAIAHDSNVLKNVGDVQVDGILKLYTEFDKQVFIALDKASSYTDDVLQIVNENTVLKLTNNGGEFYGKPWNKE